jgi:hypothetical protein
MAKSQFLRKTQLLTLRSIITELTACLERFAEPESTDPNEALSREFPRSEGLAPSRSFRYEKLYRKPQLSLRLT